MSTIYVVIWEPYVVIGWLYGSYEDYKGLIKPYGSYWDDRCLMGKLRGVYMCVIYGECNWLYWDGMGTICGNIGSYSDHIENL